MCKLFKLIVPGCLKETVLKACAKYAASTLAYVKKMFTYSMMCFAVYGRNNMRMAMSLVT